MRNCPTCGSDAIEITTMGQPAAEYIGQCTCYPKTRPTCPCCHYVLVAGRCAHEWCQVYGLPVPLPTYV